MIVIDFLFDKIGKAATVALAVGLAMALILWGYNSFVDGKTAKVEARLGKEQTDAALNSGRDAVETVAGVNSNDADTDATTRSNDRDIRTAPGADAPVDPAVAAAGRRSLCKRAANRDKPECLQYAPTN